MAKTTVRDLLHEGKPMYLMTPGGYVYITVEMIEQILSGKLADINGNAGVKGCDMSMSVEELLNYELIRGGFNEETGHNEYLVDVHVEIK